LTLGEAIEIAPLLSALIAGIAAAIAAASAAFAGVQLWLARRTAVLQVLQQFDKTANDRESSLGSADTNRAQQHALHELLNFLELYAGICNRKLVTGLARELVRDRLIDSVVVIERAEAWHEAIDRAVFHETTFSELRTFLERNRRRLNERRVAVERRAAQIKASNMATETASPG
jgi:hypothetical protein